jgi:hypothetical protein
MLSAMKRPRSRKCLGCGQLYRPDPRNLYHQRYCSLPNCQTKSHAASQRQWLAKPANREYFCGPEHRDRMRRWRKKNPGRKRKMRLSIKSVNDDCPSQVAAPQENNTDLSVFALQDDYPSQLPLLVGFVSKFTGLTLQEDIARSLRQFHSRGQQILGGSVARLATAPRLATKGDRNVVQTSVVSSTIAAGAVAV